MYESSKTYKHLSAEEKRILEGRGIDIGCGPDPIRPHVIPFDMEQGDANTIQDFVKEQFDFVFSSHCLEHMRDVRAALLQWWGLVRPEGYLIFIVPDEDLYEQGVFPSRFNADHKATFTISKEKSWSPVSYNVLDLALSLPGGSIVSIRLQDEGLDRSLIRFGHHRPKTLLRRVLRFYRKTNKKIGPWWSLLEILDSYYKTQDQTQGDAMAQILCIVRKS